MKARKTSTSYTNFFKLVEQQSLLQQLLTQPFMHERPLSQQSHLQPPSQHLQLVEQQFIILHSPNQN